MFTKMSSENYKEAFPGVDFKTLVYGKSTMLCEFHLKKGTEVPKHKHTNEQTGYLIKGELLFNIDNEEFMAKPSDSWCIPGNVEHSVSVIEDSSIIEVFSPVRNDYL